MVREGYKKTEVGVIPEDWDIKSLSELSEKITVGIASAATHAYRAKGIPLIRNQNIKPNQLDDKEILYISEEYESRFKNKRLKKGDLLTARTGYPGTTCIVPEKFDSAQSFTTLITRLKQTSINDIYLSFFINSDVGQSFFEQNQIGGGQKNVNAGTLRNLLIPVPERKEQRSIAQALSDVDALIAALEKTIAKKRAIKTATMQQLLTGKKRLPGFGEGKGYKESEVGIIPKDWDVQTLDEMCTKIQDGTHFSPKIGGSNFYYITSKNIGRGFLNLSNAERIDTAQHEAIYRRCDVKKGDLLLTKDGVNTGNAALNDLDEEFSLLSSVALLRFKPQQYEPAYFLHLMLSSESQNRIKELVSGNAITRLTLEKIRKILFPFPPLEEQRAISTVLSDMDAEITALEIRLAKTQSIKQGMMQELLTGRTRLV